MKLKILIVISVLLGQIFLISCTSTPWHRDQADASLKKGMALIEAGQYLGALKELLEADKNAPNDPVINYHLGIAYQGRGLRDMAMERFQKAVSLKKDYSEAHNYIGVIYMDMGQWEKAIDSFDKALANYLYASPEYALYNSGLAYYNLQKYDMALSRYQQALIQDRMSVWKPQIEKNIGLIYIKQSNLAQAKEHLEKSVTLNPSLYDAHFFLGETYLKIRDTANAKKSFQQVVKLAPQSPLGQKAQEYLQSLR
jgi:type IV pilus assembly protein PilF